MYTMLSLLFFLLTCLFIILGVQFHRGRWLRLLAGNTFGDLPKEKTLLASKETSHLMYFSAVFCLFIWWWLTFSKNRLLFWCGVGLALIVYGITLIKSLKEWLRTGY